MGLGVAQSLFLEGGLTFPHFLFVLEWNLSLKLNSKESLLVSY